MKNRARSTNHGGFSLIELVMSIIILAIMMPLSYVAYSGMTKNMGTPDYAIDARYAAEIQMEQLTRVPFASIATCNNAGCTNYSYHDMNAGGSYPEYAGFKWKCVITPVVFTPATNKVDDSSSTTMKRIEVDIQAPNGSTYSFHTLVSQRPADEE